MNKELAKKAGKPAPRFFYPGKLGNGSEIRLTPDAAHHAARVLRLAVGEPVVVFNGLGGEFEARITRIDRSEVAVKTGAHLATEREAPLELVLAQGLSSGDRMDFTLQKAVELGVSKIQPLSTERSVVKLSGERAARRAEHWQNLAVSACEQCGRNQVPAIAPLLPLANWLADLSPACGPGELRLLLSPQAEIAFGSLSPAATRLILLAGPEGGFSRSEAEIAQMRGFAPIRLGPRVLRTETAAIAALAAIQARWGDF
ncbi:MAG: 16S rRNA (uracil(1498)-N(3))-methyltransferase [Burkholderiales bacterium]